ncbi:MAG TPA: LuxR C-terminal-related transcriptional regulator [Candidatus Brocadiaceae bacterium]
MNKEIKGRLVITPINPFTPRQGEITELVANGLDIKGVGIKLGISPRTVRNHISGTLKHGSVYDRIARIKGKRPTRNFISPMIGDVLFFREES